MIDNSVEGALLEDLQRNYCTNTQLGLTTATQSYACITITALQMPVNYKIKDDQDFYGKTSYTLNVMKYLRDD